MMGRISFKLFLFVYCLIAIGPAYSKIDPPNYNFSIDTLKDFYPDAEIATIEKKYGKAEVMSGGGGRLTLKFYVSHMRFKFPVIVQALDGKVLDMFARMPTYFLHDVFHQSLINRLGKQDQYKRYGEEAMYRWNKTPLTHVYSATCTITCFPIFYSVYPTEIKTDRPFTPLLDLMKKANSK